MAEYRTIRVSFWNDPYIEDLSPVDKLLYIYLFTCPHVNNLGLIEVSQKKIAFETGLVIGDVKGGLLRMAEAGKVIVDGQAVWLVNFIKHQATTSPKLIQSIKRLIPSITSHTIKREVCLRYPHIFDDCDTVSIPSDTVSIPSDTVSIPSRELERELEREVERIPPNPPLGGEGGVPDSIPGEQPEADQPSADPGDFPSIEFEQFWEAYPRKEKKITAWKAWRALGSSRPGLAKILAAVCRFAESDLWQKENGRYVQQPHKWLEGRRWLDEPTTTADTQEGPPPVRSYSDEQLAAMGINGRTW